MHITLIYSFFSDRLDLGMLKRLLLLLLSFGYLLTWVIIFPIYGSFVGLRHSSPPLTACGPVDL